MTLGSARLTTGNDNTSTPFSGMIAGTGGLSKVGTGTLTLSGSSSYGGATEVNAGTLQAGAINAFSPLSAFTVASGATLGLANFNQSINSLAGAGGVTLGTATLTTGNDNSSTIFSGVISGGGALTKIGTGTFVLSGLNTYTGNTTISGGTLQLGSGGTSGSILGDVGNNGTLAFNRSDTVTFPGVISGTGNLAQIGTGTTILTGTSPYTGGTGVGAGTLVVGDPTHPGAALSGGGPITVAPGATLGGYGSVTGTVNNFGIVAAGNGTPLLTRHQPEGSPSLATCSIEPSSNSLLTRSSGMYWRFAATMSVPAAQPPSSIPSSEAITHLRTGW